MRIAITIIITLLVLPIVFSQTCNSKCIQEGFSSGICTKECKETKITGAEDCGKKGEAFLAIGSGAIDTFENNEAYIGESKTNPNWIWIIKNIRTNLATNILDEDNDATHTGPIIGIKNDFIATDIDNIGVKAKSIGESFCFPDNIICITFKELTVTIYGTYVIQKTTVDLSAFNTSWTNKNALVINSVDDANGLKMQTTGYDSTDGSADGTTTDTVWIVYNNTGSYAGVFYKGASNTKKLAGYINMNNDNDDVNIADVNYIKTQDNDVQIDLRGNFGTTNALDIVLDILAKEGAASVEGADDITINLKHAADNEITGLGNSSTTSESDELLWTTTAIGTKDEDHRSLYGIIIKDPKTNGASDKVELEIPADQVKAKIEITRSQSSITKIGKSKTTVLGEEIPSPILSSELKNKEADNIILVGGPCVNPPLETFSAFPTCKGWPLKEGEAMIKYAKNGNNTALLIAGTTAQDTKMATEFVKNFEQYPQLRGEYIILRGKIPEVVQPYTGDIDFSDYPFPFIKEGKVQNMKIVVGDNSKAEDTIGAQDIVSGLFLITRRTSQYSNITIDDKDSNAQTKDIPLGNNLGDATFFSKSLTSAEIKTLISHEVDVGGKKTDYKEVLMLYNTGPEIATSLSSNEDLYESGVFMEATAGSMRYYFVFEDKTDLTKASASSPIDINFLEKDLSITDAETATKFKSQSATKYFMHAGDKVTVDGKEVTVVDIDAQNAVVIKVNNTEEIIPKDKYEVMDGLKIKNIATFEVTSNICCCADILSGLT